MFIFLPVWHKDTDAIPFWTIGLILLNLFVFMWIRSSQERTAGVVTQDEIIRQSRPLISIATDGSNRLSPELVDKLKSIQTSPITPDQVGQLMKEVDANKMMLSSSNQFMWDSQYPVFRGIFEQWKTTPEEQTAFSTYGLIAGETYFPRIITHQFMHAGWMHLIGNMLFLFIAGTVLEKRLGILFPVLFILGGMAAAYAQLSWSTIPRGEIMVGASGSISALVGFVLSYVPSAQITMFYMLILSISPRLGTIDLPAWVVIPIWLGSQVLLAHILAHSTTTTVAFIAHIGGCLFGIITGLIIRMINPAPPTKQAVQTYF